MRNLRALHEVARCGGFSAAAKAIGTSQSTISKAIAQLEHDCGLALVERLGRGVRLTAAGEIVRIRAANMLNERDHLLAELAELKGVQIGKLRLGLPAIVSSVLFATPVAAFRKKYPGIEVELHEQGSRRLEEEVRKGNIEVGGSILPIPDELEFRLVREEPLMVLLPLSHPMSGRNKVKLADLAPGPVILFETGFGTNAVITAAFQKRGLPLGDAGRSGNMDFIFAMVAADLGIAFLPRVIAVARLPRSVRAVLVDEEDMWWRLALIWRKGATLSPAALRWVELAAPLLGRSG